MAAYPIPSTDQGAQCQQRHDLQWSTYRLYETCRQRRPDYTHSSTFILLHWYMGNGTMGNAKSWTCTTSTRRRVKVEVSVGRIFPIILSRLEARINHQDKITCGYFERSIERNVSMS